MDVRTRTTEGLRGVADRMGITPWSVVVGAVAVTVAGFGAWWALATPAPPPVEDVLPRVAAVEPSVASTMSPAAEIMVVHVDGAVGRPGVHELAPGARVIDAIEAAGGLTQEADRSELNLAQPLLDGQRVWVPAVGSEGSSDPPAVVSGGMSAGEEGGAEPVDLNQATASQLETLPGVGPSIAATIIEHRTREGPFQRVEDLLEVPGIGPTRLEQLAQLVQV